MFFSTVVQGISAASWKTKPTLGFARLQETLPVLGAIRPAMRRSAVLLPQPEGPTSETNSPAAAAKLTRSSASVPFGKVFVTLSNERSNHFCSFAGGAGTPRPLFTKASV